MIGLEPGLADHRNQAARTVTLPTAPPRQAHCFGYNNNNIIIIIPLWVGANRAINTSESWGSKQVHHVVIRIHDIAVLSGV